MSRISWYYIYTKTARGGRKVAFWLWLATGALIGAVAAFFLVRFWARLNVESLSHERRICMQFLRMPVEEGREFVLVNPHDPLWRGRAEYVERRIRDLVAIAKLKGLVHRHLFPIRVGVAKMFNDGAAFPDYSVLILTSRMMCGWRGRKALDDLLAHEFAHLVTADDHGPQWRREYRALHRDLCLWK